MTSSEFRGDLDPITSFLIRERYRDSDKGKTENLELFCYKQRNTRGLQKLEEARSDLPVETEKRAGPANILILDFWPP